MRSKQVSLILILVILFTFGISACKSSTTTTTTTTSPTTTPKKGDKDDESSGINIRILNSEGKPIFKLKEKKFGFKMVSVAGGDQKPVAKLKITDRNMEVQDANSDEKFKVTNKDTQIEVADKAGKPAYVLVIKDKDYELQSQNKPLYRMKAEGEEYKISDEKDQVLASVKKVDNKLVLAAKDGKTLYEFKGLDNLAAASMFACDKLQEKERASLLVWLVRRGSSK